MGLKEGPNGVALVLSCLQFLFTTFRNEYVSRPLGASARRVLPTLDNLCGGKNAASQKALACLSSGDCRFGAHASAWMGPERVRHHHWNRYGYQRGCNCQGLRHTD